MLEIFEALVERYRDSVYGMALRLIRSETGAADCCGELPLRVPASERVSERGAVRCLVHWSAAERALTRFRHDSAAPAAEGELKLPEFNERGSLAEYPETDWSRRAEEEAINAELRRAVQEATDQLPQRHRESSCSRTWPGSVTKTSPRFGVLKSSFCRTKSGG